MSEPITIERKIFVWGSFVCTTIITVPSIIILLMRRHHEPLTFRSWLLVLLLAIGFWIGSLRSLLAIEQIFDQTWDLKGADCATYWIVFETGAHLTATPILIGALRLYLVFRFETLKRHWMRRTLHEGDVENIVRQRRYFGNKWLMAYFLALVIVSNFPKIIKIFQGGRCVPESDSLENYWRIACWVVMGSTLAYLMRKHTDALGMKTALGWAIAQAITGQFLPALIRAIDKDTPWQYLFGPLTIIWYPYVFALVPCLETFPALRYRGHCFIRPPKHSLVADQETIYDILATDLGQQYFLEHLRREFSEEQLLCVLMIYELRAKPSYARVQNILQKYVDHDAPLSVNVSATAREIAIKRASECRQDTKPAHMIDVFNTVQDELLRLMGTDSLMRFKKSKLWKMYKNKSLIPVEWASNNDSMEHTVSLLTQNTEGRETTTPASPVAVPSPNNARGGRTNTNSPAHGQGQNGNANSQGRYSPADERVLVQSLHPPGVANSDD